MNKIVTLIPGDGIGPEIAKSLTDIFSAAEVPVVFEIENLTLISQHGLGVND